MFAPHGRLFALWAGLQSLLVLSSGVPHLECACREVVVELLPGNGIARSSTCCCSSSMLWAMLGGTSDRQNNRLPPCCRRAEASSTHKVPDGVCASPQSSCHRKVVPPDAAMRLAPLPVDADAANVWLAFVAPALPAHWLATATWRRTGLRPEPVELSIGCLHRVLRI